LSYTRMSGHLACGPEREKAARWWGK